MSSNNYRHQITDDFEKLLDLKGVENTKMIITPIFLVFHILIKPTRLLKNNAPNAKLNAEERLRPGSTGLNWDNSGKIEKAIVMDKNAKDKEDLWERNRQLKREKQYQKQAAKAKTCQQVD